MNVLFRADASLTIGTGHVMRCLTLAEELRLQGHSCQFVCRNHRGHLADLIESRGFICHLLSYPDTPDTKPDRSEGTAHSGWLGVGSETDAKQTLSVVDRLGVDWLVVDHYALDSRWEKLLASVSKRLLVIDDLADREHHCDLLLDQNLGRKESEYRHRTPEHCVRLVGPKYALLRPEFAMLRGATLQRRRNQSEVRRILISLGGVDADNVTGEVLNALKRSHMPHDLELDVIMGPTAPHLTEVQKLAKKLPFRTKVSINVTDMADRMCLADLSIGAAGSTSWERCCLGLPVITVILAENQRGIGDALLQNGCAYLVNKDRVAGELGLLVNRMIRSREKLESMTNNAQLVADGNGTSRLVSEMTRIAHP